MVITLRKKFEFYGDGASLTKEKKTSKDCTRTLFEFIVLCDIGLFDEL